MAMPGASAERHHHDDNTEATSSSFLSCLQPLIMEEIAMLC